MGVTATTIGQFDDATNLYKIAREAFTVRRIAMERAGEVVDIYACSDETNKINK
jgi:hypothetical protein